MEMENEVVKIDPHTETICCDGGQDGLVFCSNNRAITDSKTSAASQYCVSWNICTCMN